MGYLVSPPQRIEENFVAIFAQTSDADSLAVGFLESRGIDARLFPIADATNSAFGGIIGNVGLVATRAYVCVPESQAEHAISLLESESGLVD